MMGLYVYQATLRDFFRLKRIVGWIMVAILVGVAAFAYQTLAGTSMRDDNDHLTLMFVYRLLPLAAAIYSVAVINQEVTQKTIVYLVTRPIPRSTILIARSAAAMTVSFAMSFFCACCVAGVVLGWDFALYTTFWDDVLTLAVGACAYTSLFVLISLWINRAMIVTLLYAFGLELMAPRMNGNMFYLSIGSYLTAISGKKMVSSGHSFIDTIAGLVSSSTLTPNTAWPIVIIIIVGCTVAAAWWFSHFEYVPREDAE